jgi:gliding motility-associated-like protein
MLRNLFILALVLLFTGGLKAQIPNPVNFNTATNATNTGTLPVGSNDLNWTACSTGSLGPYIPAVVCGNQAPCCWANATSPNVNWIVFPHTCSASPAEHACLGSVDEYYKLSFNLPASTPCGQPINQTNAYCLSIDFYSDNCVWEIFVNGISNYLSTQTNPYYYSGHQIKTSVNLCSNWQPGTNNIIVHVKSGSNPFPTWTGFMAEVNLTQSTSPSTFTNSVNLSVNPSYSVCSGSSISISATGATSYTWNPGGFTGQSIVVSPPTTTIYTVTGSNGSCSSTATTSVNVTPSPTIIALNNGPVCSGGSVTLSASGAATYTWNPGQLVGSSVNVFPVGTTTYTVTGENAGCLSSGTTAVVINNSLNVTTSGSVSICIGNSATLSAGGAANYTWNPTGSNSSQIIVTPSTTTTYTVIGATGNCTNMATSLVVVNQNISVNANASPAFICSGGASQLSATGAQTYTWFPGAITGPVISVNPQTTTTYSVIGEDGACTSSDIVVINILPTPNVSAAYSGSVCEGGTIQLFANGTSGYIYHWSGPNNFSSNEQDPIISTNLNSQGVYLVTLTDSSFTGCGASATVNVNVLPKPVADFNYSPYEPLEGEEVVFTDASYQSISQWNWFFQNTAQYTSIVQNPTFTYNESGTYPVVLIVKNEAGCSDTIIKVINVQEEYAFYIPNTFTPNNDGLNDIFGPKGRGIKKYEINIFDRWGEKLFESTEFNRGWDGFYKGKLCPSDVYIYQVNLTNTSDKHFEFTGHVTLIK